MSLRLGGTCQVSIAKPFGACGFGKAEGERWQELDDTEPRVPCIGTLS